MTGTITDSFEIKGRTALEYGAAGVVIIVTLSRPGPFLATGDPVVLVRGDGWLYRGVAEDVRASGDVPCGLFLRGLTKSDVPIGSQVRWGDELWPHAGAVA